MSGRQGQWQRWPAGDSCHGDQEAAHPKQLVRPSVHEGVGREPGQLSLKPEQVLASPAPSQWHGGRPRVLGQGQEHLRSSRRPLGPVSRPADVTGSRALP